MSRPLFENATDVMPHMMLSCEYMPISWSERMSNSRQVASSEPVAKAKPLGKNYSHIEHNKQNIMYSSFVIL